MDEGKVREHAERHGKAACDKAEILSIEPAQDDAIVHTRYSGPEKTVTIRSRSEERGGTPMIVDAGPVE